MSDRSRTFRTNGLVLRRVEYGEADLILTVITPRVGKIGVIAKGVRRPKSRASGHVELYSLSDMLLARGRNLNVLSQITLIEPFLLLGEDLERIAYANHFAELTDRFTVDEQENLAAFNLIVNGLRWLCEPDIDLRTTSRYFELKLLEVMGYEPSLFLCASSGDKLDQRNHFYSAAEGGVVHAEHAVRNNPDLIPLPLTIFKILRHFKRHQWEAIRNMTISETSHAVLERVLHSTLAYLLERNLQSFAFLKRIALMKRNEQE